MKDFPPGTKIQVQPPPNPPTPQTRQKHLVPKFCQVRRRGWRPARPRPALPFSSILPPTLSALDLGPARVSEAQLAELELPNTPISFLRHSKAKRHPQQATTERGAARGPAPRSAARRGRGRPLRSAFHRWSPPCRAPGLRQPEPAPCTVLGPGSQCAPERTWLRPAFPRSRARAPGPPASGAPRAEGGGVPASSQHPDKQHPTLACPRVKSVSAVRDPANRDPEGLQGPQVIAPDFSAQPVEESLGAQVTGMNDPALALGSLQALRSAPVGRCVYAGVSGGGRQGQKEETLAFSGGERLRCRRGRRQELPATRWRQRHAVFAHP